MRQILTVMAAVTAVIALVSTVRAGIIVNTIPDNDRANLAVNAGQSFTTGVLGGANRLSTIEIKGPRDVPSGNLGPFVLALYDDVDQDPNTFDRGGVLGTSTMGTIIAGDGTPQSGGITTFSFNSLPLLADNKVYSFRYEDGLGTAVTARVGLTNGLTTVAGGTGAPPLTNGAVFSNSATAFGNAFDTAMRITTIPEPASLALGGVGLACLLAARRRHSN